jgi:hypothetical protein
MSVNLQDSGSIQWAAAGGNLTASGPRVRLAAALSLYVATTGNDTTGDGSVGAPWATIQKAIDYTVDTYDFNGYEVTINVADGTYAENVNLRSFAGAGRINLEGNTTTPANVHVAPAAGRSFSALGADDVAPRSYQIRGFKVTASSQGFWFQFGQFSLRNIDFGVCLHHLICEKFAFVLIDGAYTVSGNADVHMWAGVGASIQFAGTFTVTFSGSPAWAAYGWYAAQHGRVMNFATITNSGTVTGSKYRVETQGLILGSATAPGSTSGTTATGGIVT